MFYLRQSTEFSFQEMSKNTELTNDVLKIIEEDENKKKCNDENDNNK